MIIPARTLLVLCCMALLSACHASHSALTPEHADVRGLDRVVKVGDLLIGGQPTDESLEVLSSEGYRDIVSVRAEGEIDWDEASRVRAAGMSFHRIEMPNPVSEITDGEVAAFAQFMEGRDGPALLHCGSGNRAAALWAAWLIEYRDVEPEDAVKLGTAAGMRDSMKAVLEARVREREMVNAKR